MPVASIQDSTLEFGRLHDTGRRWCNGTTWHVSVDPGFSTGPVECYEVVWDADGQGHATGNRKMMTRAEAGHTQSGMVG